MPPPELSLELLLMIAYNIRDDNGGLCYGGFNSFLQVNRVLYACLNRQLWKKATEQKVDTQRVFMHLLKTNDLTRLEFFLELGADVEVRLPAFELSGFNNLDADEEDWDPTPLLVAANVNNVPLARLLLEKGAKVQYTGGRYGTGQFSPLHAARSVEMVQLLLDHNADPNLDAEDEWQPLQYYAAQNNIAAMRMILQHGAEVNPDRPSEKPLHEAARCSLEAVKLLLEYGADMDRIGPTGITPLHVAAGFGPGIEVVELLVEGWPEAVREQNLVGNTPLHMAAARQRTEVVRFLVERWPEGKEALNQDGKTPLSMFEATSGHKLRISDKEKEEMIALLGGPNFEVNNH